VFYHKDEEVYTEVVFNEDYVGYENIVHGGILAALLDESAMWACVVQTGKMYYTVQLTIRYKKKLPPGLKIKVIGKLTETKKRYAVSESKIIDENNNIYATAIGKYFPLPDKEEKKIRDSLE